MTGYELNFILNMFKLDPASFFLNIKGAVVWSEADLHSVDVWS